jgi:PAS domain S-box-containing protein
MVTVDDAVLHDPARMVAVDRLRQGLAGARPAMDAVASLAARMFEASMAVVTLVGDEQEFFVGVHNLPAALARTGQAPLAYSVCKYMVSEDRPVRCDDMHADADPELRHHLLAVEYGVRAFLGVPLRDHEDRPVGSLTVLDPVVRRWADAQVVLLVDVAEDLRPSLLPPRPVTTAPTQIDSRSLLDSVHEAFLAVDRGGVVVEFNRAAQELFGFSSAQVCGWHVDASLLPDYGGQPIGAALARLFTAAPRRPVLRTLSMRHSDGHPVMVRASLSVIPATAGPLACMLLTDVSAQAVAEEAAERNGQFLTAVLDSLSAGVVACNEHGRLVLANRAMREAQGSATTGAIPADFLDTAEAVLQHADSTPMSREQTPLMRALRGEHVPDTDILVQVPGRRLRTFTTTARPITNDGGRLLGAVAVAHEITAARRVERFRACHGAVARALTCADSPQVAAPAVARAVATTLGWPYVQLWQIDAAHDRLQSIGHWTDPAFGELADHPVIKGAGVTGRVWKSNQSLWVADLAQASWLYDAPISAHVEALLRRGVRTVLSVPVRDGDTMLGVLTGYAGAPEPHEDQLIVLLEGVAAHVGVHLALRRADQLGHQLQRAQDDFLALVGHELRTPLTSIAANAALLGDDAAIMPDDDQQMVRSIERNTATLQGIVDTLLDLAGMDSGYVGLTVGDIDLGALAAQVVAAAEPLATANRVRFITDLPERLAIDGDQARLSQLIDDLLSNSIKYSPDGTMVHVRLRRDGDMAELAITDRGIGVPAGELDQLFDRFYRASNVRHQGPPGSGLGLSRARTIVHLHSGTITITGQQTSGTAVTVRLPLHQPDRRP